MEHSHNNRTEEILKEEKAILREEKEILEEVRKEEKVIQGLTKNVWMLTALVSFVILGTAAGFAYWKIAGSRVYTDKAQISAPHIGLAPHTPGVLEEVFVHEGDAVSADALVARVDNELIKAKTAGIIVSANTDIGKRLSPGEPVVTMIDPNSLRVVTSIEEDKGLSDVRVGQVVAFTVDAFGSKEYEGVVDEISPSSHQGDVVFNISDKRETKEFDVKVRFDVSAYPELKDGMSAKVWIFR